MKFKLLYLNCWVLEFSNSSLLKCFAAGPDDCADSNGETRVLCILAVVALKMCDRFFMLGLKGSWYLMYADIFSFFYFTLN